MEPMYRGIPFSPRTTLADSIGAADTIIPVADVSVFPDPPNYATIGIDEDGETISYAAKTDHALSGCTRGVEGTPKSWASGSVIARNFTAKDLESLQKNLRKIVNDAPFVSAGSAQTLTDAQKEQARVNIGASHIRVESTNIGGDTVIQVVVTDANGNVSRFNPKGSDGGVWVPEYNEDTGVIDWEYHKAGDFYPVPFSVPTGIPVPATAAVGQTVVVAEVDEEGKPTKWEAGGGGANFLLTLSTNEADAQANSDAITAAIVEHKHVVLQRGDYPVKPGIVVESGKLDMNGARFYTVDYKSGTPLVYLKGESPEICNGELEGSYDLADNEAGYSFFESESLIRPEGVNDAYIHHMDLHNNWGYCIHPGEVCAKFYVDSGTVPSGINDKVYVTDHISIPEGYKFVTAAGGIGYNYIISVYPVAYYFYNADGVEILKGTGIPRKRHTIPAGAATVKIGTYTNSDSIIPYYAYFTNYEETLVVSDCKFHNYHSLGMANMPGPTTVTRCSFVEGGKPRSDVYGTFRGTVGGIDIEDIQTPEFIMSDCWSRDSGKLLLFGGYKGVISNCTGGSIGVYRGWQCDITNCNVAELYTGGSHCRITTNGVHADTVSIKDENINDVRGDISTFSLDSKNLCRFDSFVVDVDNSSDSNRAVISGKVNGRIKGVTNTGIGFKECSSAPGSRIEFDSTVTGSNGNYYGALKVTGDTYGLVSNAPFFPNGHTIHDSVFNIGALMTAYGFADVTWSGGFKNCVFNLTGGTFFRLFAKSPAEPVELIFEGCIINNADYYLFNFVPFAGSKVTFKNCTIANESKLFNGNTSGITIEFVTGGEGSVEIDASLTVEGRAADAKAVGEALAMKMPAATTAKVGQYFKVSAVDADGAVTAVEAVETPPGDTWELIYFGEITGDVADVTVDKDSNGKAFSLKEYKLVITTTTATESPNGGFSWFTHNADSGMKGPFYTIVGADGGKTLVFDGKLCGNCWYCQYISDNGNSVAQKMRNALCPDGSGGPSAVPVYKLKLVANVGNTCGAGSKVALFGVRA